MSTPTIPHAVPGATTAAASAAAAATQDNVPPPLAPSSHPPSAPIVCVVGFHHARGPEIETWFGVEDGEDPAVDNDWSYLPFMALSDGVHTSVEDFSYFTLRRKATPTKSATSLFGISCTRQLDATALINRPKDVTRSTVQKALVVVAESALGFWQLRERLGVVTQAWFAQRDFTDVDILKMFQDSLVKHYPDAEDERDQYLGLSLRELIHEYKHQTLVLFKCCLLQPKMLFFSTRCERLCMIQFSLISLIPGLLRRLEDSADPDFDTYEKTVVTPTSLQTSNRNSLLAYMGLPLQLFGKGSLFGPYTPLQQLDTLADYGTKSYMVGSTNSLLLQQRDRYSDIIINLDDSTISITSPSLRNALALSAADRRWIDFLHSTILSTWDESNPSRPSTHGYLGSEEFIRLQFEEYLLALLSSVKYHHFLKNEAMKASSPGPQHNSPSASTTSLASSAQQQQQQDHTTSLPSKESDPSIDFNPEWIAAWQKTSNYALFARTTDAYLFAIVEPKHPTAGGLSIDDINRRLTQQIQDLHLDERIAVGKEVVGRHLTTGQKKVSTVFAGLWADIEAQKKRYEENRRLREQQQQQQLAGHVGGYYGDGTTSTTADTQCEKSSSSPSPSFSTMLGSSPTSSTTGTTTTTTYATMRGSPYAKFDTAALRAKAPDLTHAQASVNAAGQKAGAYLSSWGSWASEKRKGWGQAGGGGGGRGAGSPSTSASVSGVENGGSSSPMSVGSESRRGAGGGFSLGLARTGTGPGMAMGSGTEKNGERFGGDGRGSDGGGGSPIKSSVRSPRRKSGGGSGEKEKRGVDGIGRLDA